MFYCFLVKVRITIQHRREELRESRFGDLEPVDILTDEEKELTLSFSSKTPEYKEALIKTLFNKYGTVNKISVIHANPISPEEFCESQAL